MNTYSENLQATVNKTLAELSAQQTQLASTQVANDYTLYYAQEAQLSTQHSLADLRAVEALGRAVNDQSLLNENSINNLLQSATMANTDIGASNTNMATAAANVNVAANAIAALAADIGSALNNTIASLFNTEVHKQVLQANSFINEVANDARDLSRRAMEASSKTSEVVAPAVVQQVTDMKAKIDGLLKITQAAQDATTAQVTAGKAAADQAIRLEQQAEGAVLDIASQVAASSEAYRRANNQLNLGLEVKVNGSDEISVSFSGLSTLLPVFRAQPASEITIPAAQPFYYLTLLPSDQVATFSADQAQQLFAQKGDKQFQKVSPNAGRYTRVKLAQDVYGQPIVPGTSYVAYLYIELSSMEYRRFIGDFSDTLSSPSLPFTPALTLPLAQKAEPPTLIDNSTNGELATLHFSAAGLKPEPKGLEWRCILVESARTDTFELLASETFRNASIYFNLDIVQQVAPANYEVAQHISSGKPGKKKGTDAEPVAEESAAGDEANVATLAAKIEHYTVSITTTTTDNFGNVLRLDTAYQPYILTLVNSDSNEQSGAYVSVLSDQLETLTLKSSR